MRSGLRRILESHSIVLGDVSVKEASVGSISHYSPDLVLIDLDSRSADVLECIGALHNACEKLAVLVIIELADYDLARKALALGASGIVLKVQPPAVLIAAIRELCPANRHDSMATSGARRHSQISNGGKIYPRTLATWPRFIA